MGKQGERKGRSKKKKKKKTSAKALSKPKPVHLNAVVPCTRLLLRSPRAYQTRVPSVKDYKGTEDLAGK